ncbi:MAG TPA: hypothetical protein VH520_07385 [Streptosporangiaceae bacterium]
MNPLSGVFEEAWRIYRAHAAHLLTIAFVIYIVTAVIVGLLALTGGFFGLILGDIVELFATFLLQATLIKAVQDVRDGRADLSFGETASSAMPYILPVALASILAGIAITIGLILLIVPGLILITIWAEIIPVIVLERSGALASFGRSQQLVRGNGWPVFGTLVVLFIIQIFVSIVLGIIFFALPVLVRNGLSTVIAGTLIAPFIAVTVTLVYYRLSGQEATAGVPGGPAAAGWPGGPVTPGGPGGGPYGGPGGPGGAGGPGAGPAGGPADPYGAPPPGNQYRTPPSSPPGGSSDWFGGSSSQ